MQIELSTSAYSAKRYGQPWIARVEFAESGADAWHYGTFAGGEYCGLLTVQAERGDIVAAGQREFTEQGERNSILYFSVAADGSLHSFADKAEAFMAWRKAQELRTAVPRSLERYSTEALLGELRRRGLAVGMPPLSEEAPAEEVGDGKATQTAGTA